MSTGHHQEDWTYVTLHTAEDRLPPVAASHSAAVALEPIAFGRSNARDHDERSGDLRPSHRFAGQRKGKSHAYEHRRRFAVRGDDSAVGVTLKPKRAAAIRGGRPTRRPGLQQAKPFEGTPLSSSEEDLERMQRGMQQRKRRVNPTRLRDHRQVGHHSNEQSRRQRADVITVRSPTVAIQSDQHQTDPQTDLAVIQH
jgi:hypothetical protein